MSEIEKDAERVRFRIKRRDAQIRALGDAIASSWRVIEKAIPTPDLLRKEHFEP